MARAHQTLTSRPNTRLQPFHFLAIEDQLRQDCLTEESIHELLGPSTVLYLCVRLESRATEGAKQNSLIEPADTLVCIGISNRQVKNAIVLNPK